LEARGRGPGARTGRSSGADGSVLLVPDLALERWPSMDRYARELAGRIAGISVPAEAVLLSGPRYYARYVRYPRLLRRYRPALVHVADHSYAHCLGSFPGVPSVISIHDLEPMRTLAAGATAPRALVRNILLRHVVRWLGRANRWIASSEFTATEARALLALPAERITAVRLGVDAAFFRLQVEGAVEGLRRAWAERARATAAGGAGLAAPRIVLHVGSCVPRKNVETAIAALGRIRRDGLRAILVQIGGEFGPSHETAMRDAGVADAVIQYPSVNEATLRLAYCAADVLVMPSTYEGYGLPALEAMAAGLPVVTSGAGGLREAVGGAALIVAPCNADTLAQALATVLRDSSVASRLAERGRAHAATCTWERTAEGVTRVYAELLP
jgi:glycosyltransferase involved in cell wall biosynthesis